jgi:hypothetical protein
MGCIALIASDATTLALFLAVGGLANALAHPAANLRLVGSIKPGRQALALGIKQAAIPAATFVAGISVPVVALTIGWRWAFGAASLVALLLALAPDHGGSSATTGTTATSPQATHSPPSSVEPGPSPGWLTMLLIAFGAMIGIWGGQALGTFLVSYAVESGVGEGAAGLVLTTASLAGIVARIGAGWTVDYRATSGLGELRVLLLSGALGLALLSTGVPALIWLGAIPAFAGGWGWSGVLNYVVIRAYAGAPATATGVVQAGIFVGATIGVPLFGVLVEATSYSAAWLATALSGVLAALIMTLVAYRLAGTSRPSVDDDHRSLDIARDM